MAPETENKPDFSWIIVAVDRHGHGWVMDAAPGFFEKDVLVEVYCDDNGMVVPNGLKVGLYRVTEIKIRGGQDIDEGFIEISGKWERHETQD